MTVVVEQSGTPVAHDAPMTTSAGSRGKRRGEQKSYRASRLRSRPDIARYMVAEYPGNAQPRREHSNQGTALRRELCKDGPVGFMACAGNGLIGELSDIAIAARSVCAPSGNLPVALSFREQQCTGIEIEPRACWIMVREPQQVLRIDRYPCPGTDQNIWTGCLSRPARCGPRMPFPAPAGTAPALGCEPARPPLPTGRAGGMGPERHMTVTYPARWTTWQNVLTSHCSACQ